MIEPFNSCQMAACEVSQIVASIVSAYTSGLDVFRKLKCKKRSKASGKDTVPVQEEALLQASLQLRPRDISWAYESNVAVHGHRFEIGDTIAHSSLAHTLLVLNSGLINVLNNSLSSDALKRRQSQRSLLNISEVAAADALYALGQLNHRLTVCQPHIPASLPLQVEQPRPKRRTHARIPSKTVVDIQIDPKVKSRAEKNLLVRGGWVRPPASRCKSSSSVVTSATSSSRTQSTTKLVDHKRTKSIPASTVPLPEAESPKDSLRQRHRRTGSSPTISTQRSQFIAELSSDNKTRSRHHSPERHRILREPSMLLVSSDFFESQLELGPPRPPKIPLHSRPSMDARPSTGIRPRPPSVATFMTQSTKIGEIPERDPLRAMPYTIPPPLNIEDVSYKRRRGFRFWKKSEPAVQAVAY